MRHSRRLDADAAACTPQSWPDRDARPYDTPISDHALPCERLAELCAALVAGGRAPLAAIVASPLRRTLQTAGACARAAGLSRISVDARWLETMRAVRKLCAEHGGRVSTLSLLDTEARALAVGAGIAIDDASAPGARVLPPWEESAEASAARYGGALYAALAGLRAEPEGGSMLIVTHGDALAAAGAVFGRLVYDAPECSWVEVGAREGGGAVLLGVGGGVQMME